MLPLLTGYFRVIRAREVEVENKKETYTQRGLMHLNLRSCARTTRLKPLIILSSYICNIILAQIYFYFQQRNLFIYTIK